MVANGDGRGTDEVRSYEIFLNSQRVLSSSESQSPYAPVKIKSDNELRVALTGAPHSKIFVSIAYLPRKEE